MTRRKIVCIDENKCNGCGQCMHACAEGAIELHDGRARLVAEKYCDGLAACLGTCPRDAISIIEREADSFDPEAVEKHLHQKSEECAGALIPAGQNQSAPCSHLSSWPQTFPDTEGQPDETGPGQSQSATRLAHWPVQIRLIPPTAAFLKNADLLVASDCVPAAYPDFHEGLLKGKVLMMGCPKFDDTAEYVDKFAQIFACANIRSITVAVMEVPCCSKMPAIVRSAMLKTGRRIPMKTTVIGRRGDIKDMAAA